MKFDSQDFDALSPRQKKSLTDLLLRISEDIDSVREIADWRNPQSPLADSDCESMCRASEDFFNDMYVALLQDDLEDKGYKPIGGGAKDL